jgi:hypothetical protein
LHFFKEVFCAFHLFMSSMFSQTFDSCQSRLFDFLVLKLTFLRSSSGCCDTYLPCAISFVPASATTSLSSFPAPFTLPSPIMGCPRPPPRTIDTPSSTISRRITQAICHLPLHRLFLLFCRPLLLCLSHQVQHHLRRLICMDFPGCRSGPSGLCEEPRRYSGEQCW